ncbi:hypothetical protein CEXT_374271 [Caerostris extrusa]|uniref:Uncharacterized protein n=1 Tax=Caerostris extrusa TaxID=172846 RepID=A0AAV4NJF5_CAEEX|nr:hypothetical protein CEXT_374271 [Caerostris extrusa]
MKAFVSLHSHGSMKTFVSLRSYATYMMVLVSPNSPATSANMKVLVSVHPMFCFCDEIQLRRRQTWLVTRRPCEKFGTFINDMIVSQFYLALWYGLQEIRYYKDRENDRLTSLEITTQMGSSSCTPPLGVHQ